MISLDAARRTVVQGCSPLGPVRWPLASCDGCVTAETVHATDAVPPFANSSMDGFAVRAADLAAATDTTPVALAIVGASLAGHPAAMAVGPGECMRIMTGAVVPAGADAVVPVEAIVGGQWPASDDVSPVFVAAPTQAGAFVRAPGDDVSPGDVLVGSGQVLTPARLGLLAGAGLTSVGIHPRPRVGVFTTGDELVDPPRPLGPGQIRDTNRVMLLALVARYGFEPVDLGRVPDDEAALTAAVKAAVQSCDAVVTTGGVSMGSQDLVRVVLDRMGSMSWMQVAIKPAKPFAFGVIDAGGSGKRRVPVFGLPGNPVSSLVSFVVLALPGLRRLAGHGDDNLSAPTVQAMVDGGLHRTPDGKLHVMRVVASVGHDGSHRVTSAGAQGSHQLGVLAAANALAMVPDGEGVADGETVDVVMLDAAWGRF